MNVTTAVRLGPEESVLQPSLVLGRDRLVFLHIPKTAGTFLNHYLASHYEPGKAIINVHEDPGHDQKGYEDVLLLGGHIDYTFARRLVPPGQMLTVVRDPVSRAVSIYDFWRSHRWEHVERAFPEVNGPRLAKSMSFSRFLRNPVAQANILDQQYATLFGQDHQRPATEDLGDTLARVAERLDTMAWVGVQDAWEHSMAVFRQRFSDAKPPPAGRLNDTYQAEMPFLERVERTVPNPDDREYLIENNKLDLLVYGEAVAVLYRRLAGESGPGVRGSRVT